jgi:hypothetical protein
VVELLYENNEERDISPEEKNGSYDRLGARESMLFDSMRLHDESSRFVRWRPAGRHPAYR